MNNSPTPTPTPTSYALRRYELMAPIITNAGEPSGYRLAMRIALETAGFTGWTEIETTGVWHGKNEPVVMFVIYSTDWRDVPVDMEDERDTIAMFDPRDNDGAWIERSIRTEVLLAQLGRRAMPDQEAVQVVRTAHIDTLIEA